MSDTQKSVLILDDDKSFAETLKLLLDGKGFRVLITTSSEEAINLLGHIETPTFILADRMLQGEPIEQNMLECLSDAAVGSYIVIYTGFSDLTESQRYTIESKGAIRVIDKEHIELIIKDITLLLQEFNELLDIATELHKITSERSKLFLALVGSNVGVTIIDKRYHCWFANPAYESLLGQATSIGQPSSIVKPSAKCLCWNIFHKRPVTSGPCWNCTVEEAIDKKASVERILLSRFADQSVKWVVARSTPIYNEASDIIAVREGISKATDDFIENLSLSQRLQKIAQGLIQIGFGRVRIYRIESGEAVLRGAASQTDNPKLIKSDYFKSLIDTAGGQLRFDYNKWPHMVEAMKKQIGFFITKHNSNTIFGPGEEMLNLKPPLFIVPVWLSGSKLGGFLSVDFVDLTDETRDDVISYYALEETLTWLQNDYATEIRKAFEAKTIPGQTRLYDIVQRARLGIGALRDVDGAIKELRNSFRELSIEPTPIFFIKFESPNGLNEVILSDNLRLKFHENGFTLGEDVSFSEEEKANIWLIDDTTNRNQYVLKKNENQLDIYNVKRRVLVCLISANEDKLEEYDKLCFGPSNIVSDMPKIIDRNDTKAFVTYVVNSKQPLWIPNLQEYREKSAKTNKPFGYCKNYVRSCACIPLMIENQVYGSIQIDSIEFTDWQENGYKSVLFDLAYLTALVARDLRFDIEKTQNRSDLAAMTAFSVTISGDAIWRHWASQILATAFNQEYQSRLLLKKKADYETIDKTLLELRDTLQTISFGRPPNEMEESCSIADIIPRLNKNLKNSDIELIFEIPEDLPKVKMPRFHAQNVLQILLDNGMQAIESSNIGTKIQLTSRRNESYVEIEVSNDGPNITESIKKKIFNEPVKSEKGKGVGLLIARGTSLQYGGDLSLKPSETGVCFLLKLPVA